MGMDAAYESESARKLLYLSMKELVLSDAPPTCLESLGRRMHVTEQRVISVAIFINYTAEAQAYQ
jgi:hypothetical protein